MRYTRYAKTDFMVGYDTADNRFQTNNNLMPGAGEDDFPQEKFSALFSELKIRMEKLKTLLEDQNNGE